jgi:hypothetical protein
MRWPIKRMFEGRERTEDWGIEAANGTRRQEKVT